MNVIESTDVNTPVTLAVQNMQDVQSLLSSPVKRNQRGQYVEIQQKLKIINVYKIKIQQSYMKYKDLMLSISKETGFGYNTVCNTEIPTLKKLMQALIDDTDFPTISRTSLQLVLKELGFEHTKLNHKSALTERADIVVQRQKYITAIRRYRSEGRTIYFLGETYVNAGETCSKAWMDKTMKSNRDALIVVHIGSAEGFVEGGLLYFKSKKSTADYHNEMNNTFYDWFRGILPKLKDNSVIVMDNASYHSVEVDPIPTMAWKKNEIVEWLTSKGCVIETPVVKHLIMEKVRDIRHLHHKYVIDEEALKSNKMVLRLPNYHCELNPIELAWGVVIDHVRYNHTTFTLKAVLKLLMEAVKPVTSGMWADFINQTIKEEDKLYNIDFIIEDMLKPT
ncbi:uncharacterized protein LOC132944816 [Metopolophium dirhodum]|uniref:uncharacterized protein LOC132944816 n=1 Tax=Metopolophium dirhodum TaxID=44670 RepID=UPI00298FCD63|nr:uncharacterized protein LOC132944816 [Metopolophium dirhodum]